MRQASILLVEDEVLIRMMLVEMIQEIGHRVVAEAGSVKQGRSLAEAEKYDLAILDINLQGISVQSVAEIVKGRGLPLLFLSGYGAAAVPDGFKGLAVLNKPCTIKALKRMIDSVLSEGEFKEDDSDQASQT
jgi:DNA-binding response OmpR family regulator